jgi:hypothetical protein
VGLGGESAAQAGERRPATGPVFVGALRPARQGGAQGTADDEGMMGRRADVWFVGASERCLCTWSKVAEAPDIRGLNASHRLLKGSGFECHPMRDRSLGSAIE